MSARTDVLPRGGPRAGLHRAQRPELRARARSASSGRRRDINFAFNWAYVDSSTSPTTSPAGTRSAPPGPRRTSPSSGTGEFDWQGYDHRRPHADVLPLRASTRNAIDQPLPRVLEQQAGAGLGGGGRQVRLRAGAPRAADPDRVGAAICGGAQDDGRPSWCRRWRSPRREDIRAREAVADCCCRRSASRATPSSRDAVALLAAGSRAAAHRRDLDKDGALRGRRRRHPDGRVVAEAARRGVPAGPRRRHVQSAAR